MPERPELVDAEVELEVPGEGPRIFLASAWEIKPALARAPLILLSLEDVTERRRASARFYQQVLGATADAVVVVDREGTIRDCNALVEAVLGYRPDELVGQPIETLIPERLRERHRGHRAGFFDAPSNKIMGASQSLEIVGLRKDRTEVPLQVGLSFLAGGDGARAVASIRDISEQQRTAHALEEAKLQAERANALKSEFLEATARNLGHPLHAIGILVGILGRTVVRPEAQESVSRLGQIVSMMTDALDLLLDVNRLEAGSIVPELIDYPIRTNIMRMRTEFAPIAQARLLDFRVMPSSAIVHSDRQIVDRILQNFVSNALRFTHAGRVLVGCRRNGDRLRVEVWDTGPGIPADEMGRIFGQYQRVARPHVPSGAGVGLGLYVAKGLADLLECKLDVQSLPGKGSVFSLELPLVAARSEEGAEPTDIVAPVEALPEVLIVCSDQEARNMLATILRLEGYKVEAVADANEALAKSAASGFEAACVVVDETPGDTFSGNGLLWSLRNAGHDRIRGIVLTDNETTEYAQQVSLNGGMALVKPAKAHEIIAHVAQGYRENGLAAPNTRAAAAEAREAEPAPIDQPFIVAVAMRQDEVAARIVRMLEDTGRRTESFRSGDELLARLPSAPPSCVVLGDQLPGPPITELISRLRSHPTGEIPVIMVTTPESIDQVVAGVRAGAIDVIEVTSSPERAGGAEPELDDGHVLEAVERGVAQRLVTRAEAQAAREARERLERLTPREREIATLLAAGHSNKEIASRLGLSGRTIENHRAQIRAKTRIRSLADLVHLMEQLRKGV